jgi:hypothetical protein
MHTIRVQAIGDDDVEQLRYMVAFDGGDPGSRYNLVYFSNPGDAMEFCNFLNGGPSPLKLCESGWRELTAQWPDQPTAKAEPRNNDEIVQHMKEGRR